MMSLLDVPFKVFERLFPLILAIDLPQFALPVPTVFALGGALLIGVDPNGHTLKCCKPNR